MTSKLNHVFEIIIPSQLRTGKAIKGSLRNEALGDVKKQMQAWFGGGTYIKDLPGEGFWGLETGETADEDVDIVFSNANAAQLEEYREPFFSLVAELAHKLDQEAVACRIDRKMYRFTPALPSKGEKKQKKKEKKIEPQSPRPIDKYRSIKAALLKLDSIEKARDLFCNILHYEYATDSLPTNKWPERIKDCLAKEEDPLIIAEQNKFKIIYIKTSSQGLLRFQERTIIQRIMQDNLLMRCLFVVSDKNTKEWNLINVKLSNEIKTANKFVLRRMRVSPDEHMRTVVERLALVDMDLIGETAGAADIQLKHDKAFDVRSITKEFFRKYREVFENIEKAIKGFSSSQKDAKRLFAQQLFNRLMFTAFIQKKGWLKFNESTDYLNELWKDYTKCKKTDSNFYNKRLKSLFFHGFNSKTSVGRKKIIGEVPFLNGGLFDKDDNDNNEEIFVPDSCIKSILSGLFSSFNFTVSESTPLEQEVAVDPEMLGSVFEELVTGRHESGSYYTPKPIVSFMCRQALKGYLKTTIPSESDIAISEFIENHDPSAIKKPESVLDALRSVTVCDSACGSGAYLLGMLHELMDLRECLFVRHNIGARELYDRKLEIIQTNLYGVDIDPFATNIARLRLWLSLAVDYDGANPPPLPNLDFKIEEGDSLTASNPQDSNALFRSLILKVSDNLAKLKKEYLKATDYDKRVLFNKIKLQEKELNKAFENEPLPKGAFDWRIRFSEVFAEGGFDILVANPPYGATVENHVRDIYFNRSSDGSQSKDTYGLFIARGLQLLRENGFLCYIISDTWRTIKMHLPLRKLLIKNTTVHNFLDLPPWVFEATVNTCILSVSKKKVQKNHKIISGDLRAIPNNNWEMLRQNLFSVAVGEEDIQNTMYARYTYPQILISNSSNCPFFIASPKLFVFFNNEMRTTTFKTIKNKTIEIRSVEINKKKIKFTSLANIAEVRQGLATGDNKKYLYQNPTARGNYRDINNYKQYVLSDVDLERIREDENLRLQVIEKGISKSNKKSSRYFNGRYIVHYDKGGESSAEEGWMPNYFVPTNYFIDWSEESIKRMRTLTIAQRIIDNKEDKVIKENYKTTTCALIRSPHTYFTEGITSSRVGIYSPTFRYATDTTYDSGCSNIFTIIDRDQLIAILASSMYKFLFKAFVNHTVNSQVEDNLALQIPVDVNKKVKRLVEIIVSKQMKEPRYAYASNEQIEIEKFVYEAYGLNDEDIIEIEKWFCRRYPKLAGAQGLMSKYHDEGSNAT